MRTILHSDMNNCYASIELLHRPELRGKPLAVGGDPEARHGIVLAKDQIAKKAGVKTGMALWQARQVCPDIIFVPQRMDLYLRFSKLAHRIYADYTDMQEAFGVDESWLDVTGSASCRGDGAAIAKDISRRVKAELGITVSIGVSWNKIFAKFGSDYKKPDAITIIDKENYKDIVWKQPVEDLLYVGRSTKRKLNGRGIMTIGQLAALDPAILHCWFGKIGYVLSMFANGEDDTPVDPENYRAPVKSIGNGVTAPRDLTDDEDVRLIIMMLSESVAARLREHRFKCSEVCVSIRDKDLFSFTRQRGLNRPTDIMPEIAAAAMSVFRENYRWEKPIRSMSVRASSLTDAGCPSQLDMFTDEKLRDRARAVDITIDDIRRRFGFYSIQRGLAYKKRDLSKLDAKAEHTVHPRGYFESGNRTGCGSRRVEREGEA